MAGKTTADWIALLEKNGVPGGPINDIKAVFADEQVKSRGVKIVLKRSEDGAEMPGVACPVRYSKTVIEYKNAPPTLGGQTADVLTRVLGLSDADIKTARERGTLG